MYDNENIVITSGLDKNTNFTIQSVLCALEIEKFIEYVYINIQFVQIFYKYII
jgi:hypothetical protein